MNRQEKSQEVESIRGLLDGAQLVVLTDYRGLSVPDMVALRGAVREARGSYRIMKNTLAKLATTGTELEPLHDHFEGPVGVALSDDSPVETAKALVDFQKDHEALEIKAGLLSGGEVLDAAGITALSKLPSRDQLRGKLVGVFVGVPRKFLGLLAAPTRNFVGILYARKQALEEG